MISIHLRICAYIRCIFRNIAWIMDSIELLIRRNGLDVSKLFINAPAEGANNFTARFIRSIGLINYSVLLART